MVNPIYQQDEELLLNPFGSKYLPSGTYTDVNSNQFVVQEDAVISVLTGGDASIAENSIDYKTSMNLSGVTLKKGALIVAPVGEAFKSITIDSGSIMAYNCVKSGSFVGLLDDYPDAAAAYSLRKLRTDYTGNAIEVRKTVDTVTSTQDIGFDSNGDLDTAALLSFVGVGNDGFVSKWYDQSGNGDNVNQDSASAQPKIVSNGSLITKGGVVAIDFDGVNDDLRITTPVLNEINISHFSVSSSNSPETIGAVLCQSHTTVETIRVLNDSRSTITPPRNLVVTALPTTYVNAGLSVARVNTNQILLSSFIDSSKNMAAYDNGATGGTDTYVGSVTASNGLTIGSQAGLTYLNGKVQEVILYNSNQSANRTAIETNINNFYNVY